MPFNNTIQRVLTEKKPVGAPFAFDRENRGSEEKDQKELHSVINEIPKEVV